MTFPVPDEASEVALNLAPLNLAFSPDGKVLAVPACLGRIHFFDVASGKKLKTILAHPSNDTSGNTRSPKVAFSPDGKMIASIVRGMNVELRVWDWKTKQEIANMPTLKWAGDLAFDASGKQAGGDC